MNWTSRVEDLLKEYSTRGTAASSTGAAAQFAPDVNSHFEQVSQAAPASAIGEGLAALFHSNTNGSFSELVSKLFSQSNEQQKSGLLNQLLAAGNPGVVSQILSKAGISGSAKPEQATNVPPQAVQELAAHAERNKPGIVEEISQFYAQHPAVVKTLGTGALSLVLGHIARRHV